MRTLSVLVLGVILAANAGCNRHQDASGSEALSMPADKHDMKAWGDVVRQGIASANAKSPQQPYSFVVPEGDSQEAVRIRRNESDAIGMQLQGGTVPGSRLGVGGPDPKKTADVVMDALKRVSPGRASGVTLVVVGSSPEDAELRKQAQASGASIQIRQVSAN